MWPLKELEGLLGQLEKGTAAPFFVREKLDSIKL